MKNKPPQVETRTYVFYMDVGLCNCARREDIEVEMPAGSSESEWDAALAEEFDVWMSNFDKGYYLKED